MKVLSPRQSEACRWIAQDLKLLARLHGFELAHETVEALRKSGFPESLAVEFDSTSEPIAPVMRAALEAWVHEPEAYDRLAADFAAIYLNVAYEASPNESAWLDHDHLERQEPMFEVRNWYAKYKLEVPNWRVRQEDNLSQQLLFIAHLLEHEPLPVEDLTAFMDFHILRWVGSFAERVFQRAETPFYAALALLTSRYVDELRNILAELEEKPRPTKEEIDQLTAKEVEPLVFDPNFYTSSEGGW